MVDLLGTARTRFIAADLADTCGRPGAPGTALATSTTDTTSVTGGTRLTGSTRTDAGLTDITLTAGRARATVTGNATKLLACAAGTPSGIGMSPSCTTR